MIRVRRCERVILSEEALCGVFTRCSVTGRLVPSNAATASALATALAVDDYRYALLLYSILSSY
jgi:hypothetical protein